MVLLNILKREGAVIRVLLILRIYQVLSLIQEFDHWPALSSAPTLVDGATYEIDFNGVDAAGNAATEVSCNRNLL